MASTTGRPAYARTAQQLREATPFGAEPQLIIRDNDGKSGADFDRAATGAGVRVLPHAERFGRSVRAESLDRVVVFGTRHLRNLPREYVEHCNTEPYHQGLAGRLIQTRVVASNDNGSRGAVGSRSRLGALLNFYVKRAA